MHADEIALVGDSTEAVQDALDTTDRFAKRVGQHITDQCYVMLTDGCSIISKLDELRERIRCRPPAVIAITESGLHPEISNAQISIDGFPTFRLDWQNVEMVESSITFLRG